MAKKPKASQTMRIDLHPDFAALSKEASLTVYEPVDDTPNRLPGKKSGEDTDYNKLLQSIYDGVFVTDDNGHVVDYNARAINMFAWDDDELIGTHIVDRIQGATQDVIETIKQNLSDSRHTIIDAICIRCDRSVFPAEIAVNSMVVDGMHQMCFFIRDITTRKMALKALEDAVASLEEHDRIKSQFVSNVSHELRTPLTSMIYGVTNLLKGVAGEVPEKIETYLKMMDGDCKRLLGTVNDILDLRKIDNKGLVLAKTTLPLTSVVNNAVESLRGLADQKSIKLTSENVGDSSRWFVECDPLKIERVILNLIGNSIKFTAEKGEIHLTIEDDPEHAGYVRCSVMDNGVGIPGNMIEHVTKRYFTVGEQATGSGLGLSLSKEIVEHHGGGMGIASPPAGLPDGTIVSIILPLVEAPSVMIVDDEEGIRRLLGTQLAKHGYRINCVSNGAEALKVLSERLYDLVILDLIMPEMDGAEVVMRMKSDEKMIGIPVIVVTGGNVSGAKAEILNAYSIPAMSKPWNENELLDKMYEAFLGKAVVK